MLDRAHVADRRGCEARRLGTPDVTAPNRSDPMTVNGNEASVATSLSSTSGNDRVQVALALFPGVSGDECEAFSLVLGRHPDVEIVGVGATVGPVGGIGPVQEVDRTFAQVTAPDLVVVPGGLGCAETARDGDLAAWLRAVEPTCRWVVGSSTGTVVLAAAGLLDERPVATHWLAAPLLEGYGTSASVERIVETGRVITCEGKVTAVDVALLLTARLFGPEAATRARRDLARPDGTPHDHAPPLWERALAWMRAGGGRPTGPGRPRNPELEVSEWVDLELVEMDVDDPA